jgi:cytochrome c oxidase subunit 1
MTDLVTAAEAARPDAEPFRPNDGERKLVFAHMWVAIVSFGVAACMAVMQALSRADVDVPGRTAQMYYMSVTAHGVLMALVFTTFFIMGLGYAMIQRENGRIAGMRLAWGSFWLALVGVLMATWAILTFRASVLYTFYPPLQAHWAFYVGLTLVVVGSWGWVWLVIQAWRAARRVRGNRPVSLAMHATAVNAMLWSLCTVGVAAEMLFLLIPWSLGLKDTVDPILARMLFWYFGHPLVYFWIIPAYTIWYTVLPKLAGGRLFSDPLARMVFTIFLVLSTPVGLHHQFQDPGISADWKLLHTFLTMAISFPSLVTAFTVCASIEVAGRLRGGKGLFGWIRTLPWGDPTVSAVLLAMLLFLVGGFGGAVNAAYALNSVVHNTAWIFAHFHLTVGSASALTFMGAMYWLVPRMSGKPLALRPLAKAQPFLWFAGMVFFSFTSHIAGLEGLPRRVMSASYAGAIPAQLWSVHTYLSAAGGVILFVSAMMFVLVMVRTFMNKATEAVEPIAYAEPLHVPEGGLTTGIWDRLGLWFVVAVVLVVIAWGLPLADLFSLERFGSPGFKPF